MSVEEIAAVVAQYPTRFVVVTGGEPMIAKGMRGLLAAGTVAPEGAAVYLASISPKLANSTPEAARAGEAWVARHENLRVQPEVLRAWVQQAPDFQLKFVIATREDLLDAQRLLATIGAPIPPEKILLMPEGTSVEAMRARYDLLIQASKDHGYRLSPRLHIEWFGNKRGT